MKKYINRLFIFAFVFMALAYQECHAYHADAKSQSQNLEWFEIVRYLEGKINAPRIMGCE